MSVGILYEFYNELAFSQALLVVYTKESDHFSRMKSSIQKPMTLGACKAFTDMEGNKPTTYRQF